MEELKTWLSKILLTSLAAMSVKLAFESKKRAISYFSAASSIIIGLGTAYIASDYILSTVEPKYVSITTAVITISSEKICFYIIYKFNIDTFFQVFIESFKKQNKGL